MVKKVCTKCGVAKQASKEFFSLDSRHPTGLGPQCRACVNAARKARYKANPKKEKAASVVWNKANPEKVKANSSAWRRANPEKVKTSIAACLKKNGEKYRETNRATSLAWQKANRAEANANSRAWKKANPAKRAALTRKRKAAKLQAVPKWADDAKTLAVYTRAAKKTRDTGIPHVVDHLVPLQNSRVCGLHWHVNLRVITAKANSAKGNRVWPGMSVK